MTGDDRRRSEVIKGCRRLSDSVGDSWRVSEKSIGDYRRLSEVVEDCRRFSEIVGVYGRLSER